MSIDLSKKFTSHVQTVTWSVDVIVTQLLRYHMPLLYATFNLANNGNLLLLCGSLNTPLGTYYYRALLDVYYCTRFRHQAKEIHCNGRIVPPVLFCRWQNETRTPGLILLPQAKKCLHQSLKFNMKNEKKIKVEIES